MVSWKLFSGRFINAVRSRMRQASVDIGVSQWIIISLSVLASNRKQQQTQILQTINMDIQTKNEIMAEITATAVKTIEQTVRESL